MRCIVAMCYALIGLSSIGQDLSGEVKVECVACTVIGTKYFPSVDISGEYIFRLTIPPGENVAIGLTQRNTDDHDTMMVSFLLDGANALSITGGKDFAVLTLANVTKK